MMSAPPGAASGGMAEEIECYKCNTMTDMRFIFADPLGHPLCSKCYHESIELNNKDLKDEDLR